MVALQHLARRDGSHTRAVLHAQHEVQRDIASLGPTAEKMAREAT